MERAPQQNQPGVPNYTPEQVPELQAALEKKRKIQVPLMLEAAKKKHPDLDRKELSRLALTEWTSEDSDNPNSLAARFSQFMEDPANEKTDFDVSTPENIKSLLEKIENYKPDTLH